MPDFRGFGCETSIVGYIRLDRHIFARKDHYFKKSALVKNLPSLHTIKSYFQIKVMRIHIHAAPVQKQGSFDKSL